MNPISLLVFSVTLLSVCAAQQCGNFVVEPPTEECEVQGFGCLGCRCAPGFVHTIPLSVGCVPFFRCGDGFVEPLEQCEPGGFGCSSICTCVPGTAPTIPPSFNCRLISFCGNGLVEPLEQCEVQGFGCTGSCSCATGFRPSIPPRVNCQLSCGDGIVSRPLEECDSGFACSSQCTCLPGFVSNPSTNGCIRFVPPGVCGNLVVDPAEQCEIGGFGCSACRCLPGTVPTAPNPTLNCVPVVQDPCIGRPEGFTCVPGVTSHFFQCSPPFFVGLRLCPPGTTCTTSEFITDFSKSPCQ